MKTLKELQEYIDRYRLGEVSELDFRKRLSTDSALRQEFELHHKDIQVIRAGAKAHLKSKAIEALKKQEKRSQSIIPIHRSLRIAASLVFLIAAVFLFRHNNQSTSNTELFATYFELPSPAGERNGSPNGESWNESMNAYSNEEFEKTIELLSPLMSENDFNFPDRGNLYLGLSHLMLNENQKAIIYFESISLESSYHQEAEW